VKLDIFTLFPEAFEWFLEQRPVRKAVEAGSEVNLRDYRDWTPIKGGRVDDAPYGGGAGMVIRVDVVDAALAGVYGGGERPRTVVLTPAGRHLADDEVSIGPYVLAGGEIPAMVLAETVVRRLPGALGDPESPIEESFSEAMGGRPEYPHYTRPPEYRGWEVPEVLLSGDHERVRRWREQQSELRAGVRQGDSGGDSVASPDRHP
jgi:tRNA (guanine37-N1)-methyltransferase